MDIQVRRGSAFVIDNESAPHFHREVLIVTSVDSTHVHYSIRGLPWSDSIGLFVNRIRQGMFRGGV